MPCTRFENQMTTMKTDRHILLFNTEWKIIFNQWQISLNFFQVELKHKIIWCDATTPYQRFIIRGYYAMFTYNLFRSKFRNSATHKKLKIYQNTPYFVERPTNWIMGLGYCWCCYARFLHLHNEFLHNL